MFCLVDGVCGNPDYLPRIQKQAEALVGTERPCYGFEFVAMCCGDG